MKHRSLLATGVIMATLALTACNNNQETKNTDNMKQQLVLTQEWDKVFPLSEKVNHRKVTFETQYGLTLAADLYTPKDVHGKLAAIAVSGPFGAVKEQSSGRCREGAEQRTLRHADGRARLRGAGFRPVIYRRE